ncbi:protein kinase [Kitasatospora sp. NPDC086791]|uniref:serine/threonine-protein kinase n=1 Tax=Kitasatospora sp. NPDC086791 TaxID=3155178 RepID=UPI003448B684
MQPLGPDDPRELGDYRLLGQLGAGGMGRVYLGRTPGGRTVAVKVVRREFAADARFRARFRQEVAAARKVGGDWTAPVLDADTEGAQPWVATGYVAGPSLSAAVREFGPLPEPTVRALGVGLAEALTHVHRLGLVHRDVKPSNVLITLDGPRLIDFGIARALDGTSNLTGTGTLIGSPGFMSPEQTRGEKVGAATDVFSLGAVLAYAATGKLPFGQEAQPAAVMFRTVYDHPELLGTSESLRWILLDCLAKDPDARPVPQRLRAWLDDEGTAATRLERGGWLSAELAAVVGRGAVQLLDLETEGAGPGAGGPAAGGAAAGGPAAGRQATGGRAAGGRVPPRPRGKPSAGATPGGAPPRPSRPPGAMPSSGGAAAPGGDRSSPRTVPMPGAGWGSGPGWVPGPGAGWVPGPGMGPGPEPEPRRRRRRWWRVPVVMLAVLVLVTAAVMTLRYLVEEADRATASTGLTTEPVGDPTIPVAAGRNLVPTAYLGLWRGEVDVVAGGAVGVITISVGQGGIGDESTTTRMAGSNGAVCEGAWTLRSVSATALVYTSRLAASSAATCQNIALPRVLTLLPDGTLRYDVSNGATTVQGGVVRRAG